MGLKKGTFSVDLRSKGLLFGLRSNWQSARSAIQRRARQTWVASGQSLSCTMCGYDKHVEIAHIKAVHEFSDEALIKEINAIENLIALCPNHHWEFDNLSRDRILENSAAS